MGDSSLRTVLRFFYRLQLKARGEVFNLLVPKHEQGSEKDHGPVLVYIGTVNHIRTFAPVMEHLKDLNIVLVAFHRPVQEEMDRFGLEYLKGEAFMPLEALAEKEFLQDTLRQLIRGLSPSLVIAMNNAFDEFVQEFDIPSLVVRHTLLIEQPEHILAILGSHVACIGEHDCDLFSESLEVPRDHLHITGMPRFDSLVSAEFHREEILKKYHLDPEEKYIFLVTQHHDHPWEWSQEETKELLEAIFRAEKKFAEKGKKIRFLVKTHPRANVQFSKKIASDMGSAARIFADRDCKLQELLFISDVVVTAFSTAGLEAILMDKPLVTVNLSKEKELIPYQKKGGSLGVFKEEELVPTLERALAGEKGSDPQGFITYLVYKQDGKASERIAELVRTLQSKDNANGE